MKKILSLVLVVCLISVIITAPTVSALKILEFGISDVMQQKLDSSASDDILKAVLILDDPSDYIEQKVKNALGFNNSDIIGSDRSAVNAYCAENNISFSEAVDIYKQTREEIYASATQEYGEEFADKYLQEYELLDIDGCTIFVETTVTRLNELWENKQVVAIYDYDEYFELDYQPDGTVAEGSSSSVNIGNFVPFNDDFSIFVDGEFKNGGRIIEDCGTIIDENGMLFGGEGVNNGEKGSGSFEIEIDDSGNDEIWKEYKYLRVVCAMDSMGESSATGYVSGTVQFGKGNIYNFDQIEISGKTIAPLGTFDTFLLDLSKVSNFDKNNLIFSHAFVGYKVKHLALTNQATYDSPCDLYISAVGFSASVNMEGDISTIGATVRNLSENAVNETIEVEYYVDGKLFDTVQKEVALEQGQAVNIVTLKEYEVPFGSHRITAKVKAKTSDIDSNNNTLKSRFVIEG